MTSSKIHINHKKGVKHSKKLYKLISTDEEDTKETTEYIGTRNKILYFLKQHFSQKISPKPPEKYYTI